MQYEIVMYPGYSCMCRFAVQMHYNGDDDSALIFVCWMYGTGVALAVHKQRVRLHCFVRVRLLELELE